MLACLSLDFCWVGPRGRIINLTGSIIEQVGVGTDATPFSVKQLKETDVFVNVLECG